MRGILHSKFCNLLALLFPRIVTDNINLQQRSRFESKSRQGNKFDWSNQFAVRDRVVKNGLSDECPQESLMSLDLSQQIIPSGDVLASLRKNFIPLVARVLVRYLPAYKVCKKVVIHHIPHDNSEKMAQKSEEVCLIMTMSTI